MSRTLWLLCLSLPLLGACTTLFGHNETSRSGESSSLVGYLYPDGEIPPRVDGTLPVLELPLRVGIAFVPGSGRSDFTASERQLLLERVAASFRDRPYVSSIQSIPSHYLGTARGVVGMQQVAAMHGVDVMALVSYDQISFSGERDSALLYWTIIGMMTVKGNSNEVQTLIDTAVFDVATGKLLFRAPGVHNQQRNTTLANDARDRRLLKSQSIAAANEDMIVNLDGELARFEERVKAGEMAAVNWRGGSGGGGSSGLIFMLALLALGLCAVSRKRPYEP